MGRQRWMLLLGALIACTPDLTDRERMVQGQIVEQRLNTWVRVINNARMDSLFALYDEGESLHVMWPNGRQTRGRDETERAWRDFYGQTDYMNFVLQSPVVEVVSARVAIATFRHSTDIVRSGRRLPVQAGYGVVVWRRAGNNAPWLIHLSQIAYDVPDN